MVVPPKGGMSLVYVVVTKSATPLLIYPPNVAHLNRILLFSPRKRCAVNLQNTLSKLISDPQITISQIGFLVVLAKSVRDTENDVSINELAAKSGLSKPTVIKYLQHLQKQSYINIEPRWGPDGANMTNKYTLNGYVPQRTTELAQ
jgi:predicted transcriptional regulator